MPSTPNNNFIDLKVNRDFGDLITTYFDFIKQNIKPFSTIFIRYNGIFLIGFLLISYLLTTGYIGLISDMGNSYAYTGNANDNPDDGYYLYIGIGFTLFFILFILVGAMNYSLSAAYLINYEKAKGNHFDKKLVWGLVKEKFGSVIVYMLLLMLIFVGFFIVGFIALIIPILGIFIFYIGVFFLLSWLGTSFLSMIAENKGVTDAFGEGWSLTTKSFWKSVGVNFILGLLNRMLLIVALLVPIIVIGIYTFHVVDSNIEISESPIATIVYTIGVFIYLITMVYSQCLSQFVNGILYYALHEKKYNINTRSKIEQIGTFE